VGSYGVGEVHDYLRDSALLPTRAHGSAASKVGRHQVTRETARRLGRLEARFNTNCRDPIEFRVLLVNPERGLTGVLVIEGDKPTMRIAGTPEEVERVRADLDRRRAARLLWKGGATDTHDYAPA
jgi:hypothetical protein